MPVMLPSLEAVASFGGRILAAPRRPRGRAVGERGDWWIRWSCPHWHLHRALSGPKSLERMLIQV